jgi:uncharacterized protein
MSHSTRLFDAWWFRILVMIPGSVALAIAASLATGGSPLSMVLVFAGLIGLTLALELARSGGSLLSTGLGITPSAVRHVLMGFLIATASLGVVAGVALAMGATFTRSLISESTHDPAPFIIIITMIAASVSEELFFRGVVFDAIKERFKPIAALVTTSVLFGLAHTANPGTSVMAIVNVTLAGVLMGFMVHRSATLWMAMAFHVGWNLLVKIFFGSVSGTENEGLVSVLDTSTMDPALVWFVSGPFGIEQGVVTSILLVVATVAVVAFTKPDRRVLTARTRRSRIESRP